MMIIDKSVEMDEELRGFFNKYIVRYESDEISHKFARLPENERLELIEKYMMYFFEYSLKSSTKNFMHDGGVDNEEWSAIKHFSNSNRDLMYKEISYAIDDDSDGINDSLTMTVRYTVENSKPVIRSFHIWMTYYLFDTASIGFIMNDNQSDANMRKSLKAVFRRVYDRIMSDPDLHLWIMFNEMEDTIKNFLLID